MKICFFIVKFVSHVVKSWQKYQDFFVFWRIFCHRFLNRWAHFDMFFGGKSNYMLVKMKKDDKKSHFSVSNPPYVKQSWFLIFTLVSSMGKTHRKWTKVFEKNFISPICKDGQISMLVYHWENKIFFLQNFQNPSYM